MAAAPSSLLLAQALLLLLAMAAAQYSPMTLTIFNNCPFTIWPGIQPNPGCELLEGGGFELPSLSHRSFPAPAGPWSGRIWARTGCCVGAGGRFSCDTGDCGAQFACGGRGGAVPATLAQLSLHQSGASDKVAYGVSLVDGFNVPLTVTPHEGNGVCPVVGCRADLLPGCPAPLQAAAGGRGQVVGCKSGCVAFGTDELCCRNAYSTPACCQPSSYSGYFKQACPATYTFAQDSPSLKPDCAAPKELKLIFCQ
ncbi:hypothetical protein Taro_033887 [Colocasia esculenta]|uniref:Osmotin-like protein n=1 Tax=Colocasia esculenta TaxID=4460 RepID=A0A843WA95_COLES|nr:hypothetical protein [Colocasia esculenta]